MSELSDRLSQLQDNHVSTICAHTGIGNIIIYPLTCQRKNENTQLSLMNELLTQQQLHQQVTNVMHSLSVSHALHVFIESM